MSIGVGPSAPETELAPKNLDLSRRHSTTALSTAPARLYALLHITEFGTALRTRATNLCAQGAYLLMVGRSRQHEVGRRFADFRTVTHQSKMFGREASM